MVAYIHAGGKIGVLVGSPARQCRCNKDCSSARLTRLAMHIAAASPQSLSAATRCRPTCSSARRRSTAPRPRRSGKPDNIIEKIIDGQINKFYGEICLIEQAFVKDTDKKVGKVVEALGKELGAAVRLSGFARFQLGEGIEKKEDFAAEVAAMTEVTSFLREPPMADNAPVYKRSCSS